MAKSKAKKQRNKWQREGHLHPEVNRGSWGGVNPIIKKTPTLIEKQRKIDSKYKKRFTHGDHALDKPFLIFLKDEVFQAKSTMSQLVKITKSSKPN